jgi:DNA-binding transcriptional regulator YhcF (GntR family)
MGEGSTDQVVAFVRDLIVRGRLRPGDRLPGERELATQIGVSRPSVRAGLHALAAMGVVRSRHGSGTYIPDGPPALGSEPLSFLAALHGFTRDEMYEARRILEVEAAGLAAERATSEHLATLAEEVAGMFANRDNPQLFLRMTSISTAASPTLPRIPSSARWSAWCRRSITSAGAVRSSARPTATCATRRRRTGGSIRRSARATARPRAAR